jgi:rubrerythrin
MSLLSVSEVVQFAIRIEENGYNFYQRFADTLKSAGEKEIFSYLADEEAKHIKTFENMLKSVDTFEPPTSYPDEYFAYLQAYADNLIFTKDRIEKEVAKISNSKEACEFGIRRELDSILYYQEIKPFVPENERNRIDNIITEERKHFLKLSDLKKELV